MKPPIAQRGVALIQVLLIFALVTTLATHIVYRQSLTIATTQYTLQQAQGKAWLYSIEALAMADLALDLGGLSDEETWGEWSPEFALDAEDDIGNAQWRIQPLQQRFNLNWLHPDADRPDAQAQLERLLELEGYSPAWAQRAADWMDSRSGAEFEYRLLTPGYRPSFLPLADASELRLLEPQNGTLEPLALGEWGAMLPLWAPLDLARATENMIRALHPDIDQSHWQALEGVRRNGMVGPEDWLGLEIMEPFLEILNPDDFTHEGEFYLMEARVEFLEQLLYLTSWIHRDPSGEMRVYQRHHLPIIKTGTTVDN